MDILWNFIDEFFQVDKFVRALFSAGQTEIALKGNDDLSDLPFPKSGKENTINKLKIVILSNAACIELLVWCVTGEQGLF